MKLYKNKNDIYKLIWSNFQNIFYSEKRKLQKSIYGNNSKNVETE